MRLKFWSACIVGVAGLVLGFAIARAQAPKQPSVDELRKAVSSLRGGRIPRPASYDSMTTDQQAFVKSVLSGPRGDISGSLGVMISARFRRPGAEDDCLRPLRGPRRVFERVAQAHRAGNHHGGARLDRALCLVRASSCRRERRSRHRGDRCHSRWTAAGEDGQTWRSSTTSAMSC